MTTMNILQLIIAAGLLNVWLFRFNRSTAYRGGGARSMKEEFAAYGLPNMTTYAVGTLKVVAAFLLIAGIWYPVLVPGVHARRRDGHRPRGAISRRPTSWCSDRV